MFSAGDKIVYPMHGAGVICGIEEKKILGEKKEYYIFKLPCSEINIMIPVDSEAAVGIRPIADKTVISDVIKLLGGESSQMDSNWNRRYRDNMEKLKSGDIMKAAEVVRDLMRADRQKNLSSGENKMLANAKRILISELMLASDMTSDEAQKVIRDAVGQG